MSRKKKSKNENIEHLSPKLQKKKERLEKIENIIFETNISCDSIESLLKILLPLLKIILDENWFRFLLGVISMKTYLTIGQTAALAKCSAKTVQSGRRMFKKGQYPSLERIRKKGGGRKKVEKHYEEIEKEVLKYIDYRSYGSNTKRIDHHSEATLEGISNFITSKLGYKISKSTISRMLKDNEITLRTNKKLMYGNQHSETEEQKVIRHLQFDFIDGIKNMINLPGYIILSMDCKCKEYLGPMGSGKTYAKTGEEQKVLDHDFRLNLSLGKIKNMDDLLDAECGHANPYGLYDLLTNKAYMSIGISGDTPEFIANAILTFMPEIMKDHPKARHLILLCDGGGSNSSRSKVFKYEMSILSKQIGMDIMIVHYPPYRSRYNPIERRVFAYISKKFERTVRTNLRVLKSLIDNTTTKKGLVIKSIIDTRIYKYGKKVSDETFEKIDIRYLGPTENYKVHLSYIIDGKKWKDSDVPEYRGIDIFDYKVDSTKEKEKTETRKNNVKNKSASNSTKSSKKAS